MKITKTNKRNPVKIILIVIIVLALLVGGWMVYAYSTNSWPFTERATSPTESAETNIVNYDPPTQQEIDESQDGKKRDNESNEQQATPNPPSNQKQPAAVGVSLADVVNNNLEIRAFTNSVIQGTGTCTATASMGSLKVTKTSKAFVDTSTTQCEPINLPLSELRSGKWQVSVLFSSPSHEGSSEDIEVTIP